MTGEEGQEFTVGKSAANKPLNRFKNIVPCEFKCLILCNTLHPPAVHAAIKLICTNYYYYSHTTGLLCSNF